jgi:hypothetical protein
MSWRGRLQDKKLGGVGGNEGRDRELGEISDRKLEFGMGHHANIT